jgi:hypothetical protein
LERRDLLIRGGDCTDRFFGYCGPVDRGFDQTEGVHQAEAESGVEPETRGVLLPTGVVDDGVDFGGPDDQVLDVSPAQVWTTRI